MAPSLNVLSIEEIIARAESGITEPYLCRLSDGQQYYVKGRAATPKGLIAEVISAAMGVGLGLPVPPVALVEIDPEIVAYDPEARLSLGVGLGFASLQRPSLLGITSSILPSLPTLFQRTLFAFDCWIHNEDRTGTPFGGNSNLFVVAETLDPVVIDHNLAFSTDFDLTNNSRWHICREAWYSASADLVLPVELRTRMSKGLEDLPDVLNTIPEAWTEAAPGFVDHVSNVLARCDTDLFWTELR